MNLSTRILLGMLTALIAAPLALGEDARPEGRRLFETGDFDAAGEIYANAFEADPQDHESAFYLGRIAFEKDLGEKSGEWTQRAADLAPDEADYHFWLGKALGLHATQVNLFAQAQLSGRIRKAFERAVELDAEHAGARFNLVQFYTEAPSFMGGGKDKAREQANALILIDESRGQISLAYLLNRTKEYEKALDACREGLKMNAGDADGHAGMGTAFAALAREDEARASFKRALEIDSKHREATLGLARLK